MKKLIFKASFLALATLTIFSACKKDEVIEPEFVQKAKFYAKRECQIYMPHNGEYCTGFECVSGDGDCVRAVCQCVNP